MTNIDKALLDMISYAEGTLGVSNNGYDVVIGSPYRKIVGWDENTTITHGNYDWKLNSVNSSAAGRYQFLYKTWLECNNGKNYPMNKNNQDNAAIKLINSVIKSNKSELTNRGVFMSELNNLALKWASIPLTEDIIRNGVTHKAGYSYYDRDGVNKSTTTANKLFEIFNLALTKYS